MIAVNSKQPGEGNTVSREAVLGKGWGMGRWGEPEVGRWGDGGVGNY
ncbi:hypothetical protein [Fischerella sp. PCC 9605]|nr:hypothetical protein [Fischerella sp. PCC 9605]